MRKNSIAFTHAIWVEFWFWENGCVQNPRQKKPYKNAMNLNPFKKCQ